MAETVQSLKKRIESITNTKQITRAMKMVAAAKLQKAEERAENAQIYTDRIEKVLNNLLAEDIDYRHPLMEEREVEKIRILLVSGDRGLCGSFNHNVIDEAHSFVEEQDDEKIELQFVGEKGWEYFSKRDVPILDDGLDTEVEGEDIPPFAEQLSEDLSKEFIEGEFDEFYIFYNRFESILKQVPTRKRLLPVRGLHEEKGEENIEHIYEPSREGVFESLVPKYFRIQLQNVLLSSEAGENAARMTAMDNATNNAEELIDELTLKRNRLRQAEITKELNEIVGAGEALKEE